MTMRNTVRKTILVLASAAVLSLGAAAGASAQIGNVDIRALEPPIDVTPEQLRAQQWPAQPSVGFLIVPTRHY